MSWRLRFITLTILIVFVLLTVSYHTGRQGEPSFSDKALLELVASLQNGVVLSARAVEDFWQGYFYLVNLRDENESLYRALNRLRSQVNRLREADQANGRLKELLNFKSQYNREMLGADVVAWDPNAWFKTIVINRGSSDGVRMGLPVVSDLGVVGRVVTASTDFAKVLLLIDYNSSIDAMIQRNRTRGILAGRSERTCRLKYVLKSDDIEVGDMVITSGMGGVFPKGIPLGRVTRVRMIGHDIFQEVEVTPTVNFTRLEEVMVVLMPEQPF